MKKNIAIVAGGDSAESVISLQSAKQISENIDTEKFNAFTICVKGSEWILKRDNNNDIIIDKDDFSFSINNEKTTFDCVFMAIHGTPGENGILQAYFDILKIPYTTSNQLTSALTFNKFVCNTYLKGFDILMAKSFFLRKNDEINPEKIIKKVGLPCFVKPNNGGSSFGISKVYEEKDVVGAVNKAFDEDDEIIIEEFIEGTEISCGLLKTNKKEYIFPITEIVSENDFFDYEAKYTNGMAQEISPARISKNIEEQCKQLSMEIYKFLNCKGIVRIDYIINNNQLYFLEINTVPGMSENSIVPKQIRTMRLSISDIFTEVLEDALSR
ncbi:MAG: D-alanine--D-alanine ligase [Bacteroidetes bacterium]|nr:D-alanine--D-alanine ligase [Bacteroidota bacterium]